MFPLGETRHKRTYPSDAVVGIVTFLPMPCIRSPASSGRGRVALFEEDVVNFRQSMPGRRGASNIKRLPQKEECAMDRATDLLHRPGSRVARHAISARRSSGAIPRSRKLSRRPVWYISRRRWRLDRPVDTSTPVPSYSFAKKGKTIRLGQAAVLVGTGRA